MKKNTKIEKNRKKYIIIIFRQSDDQNDQNQINVNDESMNKSITSGTTDEVRAKLLKHLEIYKANVASQEEEIKHMDELYQDLVDSVLNVRIIFFNFFFPLIYFFKFFSDFKMPA